MRSIVFATLLLAACSQPSRETVAANAANATETTGSIGGEALPAPDNMASVEAGATTNAASPAAHAPDETAYLGRWIGVEGTYLNVTRNPAGGVKLDMQYDLDNKGVFDGSVTAEGLRFTRNGVAETAAPSDGDATGLKWLAGKKRCLTVKSGEGYCRA